MNDEPGGKGVAAEILRAAREHLVRSRTDGGGRKPGGTPPLMRRRLPGAPAAAAVIESRH